MSKKKLSCMHLEVGAGKSTHTVKRLDVKEKCVDFWFNTLYFSWDL